MRELVDSIRRQLGARRAVLWDVDPDDNRARPVHASGGPPPPTISLAGDPMRWAWDENRAMRLDRAPTWSTDAAGVCVVPLHPGDTATAVLTLEFDGSSALPLPEALEPFGVLLRSAVTLERETRAAEAERARLHAVLETLRVFSGRLADDAFAGELIAAARRLAGASGALLARWVDAGSGEGNGVVLAVTGDDGGPRPGDRVDPAGSDLGMAAHGAALIRRSEPGTGSRPPPLAAPDERWIRRPRASVVVPLVDPVAGVVGLLAVWSGDVAQLDDVAVDALAAVAPFAAMQLRYALQYESVRESARRDALTGLPNRRAFDDRFAEASAHHHRYRRPFAVLVLDLDHFKQVNDTHGHAAGDAVLQAVGGALGGCVRETDMVARFGGEEFVVLAREATLNDALEIGERVRRAVAGLDVRWEGRRIPITVSIGASACPRCVENPAALLESADAALYAAKEQGRDRVVAAPERG